MRLEVESPVAAAVVRLRFYAGLTVDETAESLDLSPRSVNREWTYARAWLYRRLEGERLTRPRRPETADERPPLEANLIHELFDAARGPARPDRREAVPDGQRGRGRRSGPAVSRAAGGARPGGRRFWPTRPLPPSRWRSGSASSPGRGSAGTRSSSAWARAGHGSVYLAQPDRPGPTAGGGQGHQGRPGHGRGGGPVQPRAGGAGPHGPRRHRPGVRRPAMTDAGRPFCAMEFVDGEPITDYCRRHRVDLRRPAGDVRPRVRGRPARTRPGRACTATSSRRTCWSSAAATPKVIDFGLAKAMSVDGGGRAGRP